MFVDVVMRCVEMCSRMCCCVGVGVLMVCVCRLCVGVVEVRADVVVLVVGLSVCVWAGGVVGGCIFMISFLGVVGV